MNARMNPRDELWSAFLSGAGKDPLLQDSLSRVLSLSTTERLTRPQELSKLKAALECLGLKKPPYKVLTVAGTNGKGSAVATLTALYEAAGFKTGTYTSPHLFLVNERIRLLGAPIAPPLFIQAARAVEYACRRLKISPSWFDFLTLLCLFAFKEKGVERAILEVGLGGLMDSTNLLDPDVAFITSIGFDHEAILGPSLDSIARNKLGIARPNRPLVLGARTFPKSMILEAHALGARTHAASAHLRQDGENTYTFTHPAFCVSSLKNTLNLDAGAWGAGLLGFALLESTRPTRDIQGALDRTRLHARFERFKDPIGRGFEWMVDVAHNEDSFRRLASLLSTHAAHPLRLVLAMGLRKNYRPCLDLLAPLACEIYLPRLQDPRLAPPELLLSHLQKRTQAPIRITQDFESLNQHLDQNNTPVLVCGGFAVCGFVLHSLRQAH